jgi:hypothetical protein
LVEHQFPKLKAAGSNPVFRSSQFPQSMKYIAFLFVFFISTSSKSQNIHKLDTDYGFKQFKFGLSPDAIKDISKSIIQSNINKKFTGYNYVGHDMDYLYGVKVDYINLRFYKNRLYSIFINFGSVFKDYSDDEYEKVQYSLEKIYGHVFQTPNYKTVLKGASWVGKKVTLEHSKTKIPNSNIVFGSLTIFENNTHYSTLKENF